MIGRFGGLRGFDAFKVRKLGVIEGFECVEAVYRSADFEGFEGFGVTKFNYLTSFYREGLEGFKGLMFQYSRFLKVSYLFKYDKV